MESICQDVALEWDTPVSSQGIECLGEEMSIHRLGSEDKFWNVWTFLSPLWTLEPCHGLGKTVATPEPRGCNLRSIREQGYRWESGPNNTAPPLSFGDELEGRPSLRKARQAGSGQGKRWTRMGNAQLGPDVDPSVWPNRKPGVWGTPEPSLDPEFLKLTSESHQNYLEWWVPKSVWFPGMTLGCSTLLMPHPGRCSTSAALNFPNAATLYFNTALHVVVTPIKKIIFIATS